MTPPGGISVEAERPRVEEQAASPAKSTRHDSAAFDCCSSALAPEHLIQRTRPAKASLASLGALGSADAVVIVLRGLSDLLDALRV